MNGNRPPQHLELVTRQGPAGQSMIVSARLNGQLLRLPEGGTISVDAIAGRTGATIRLDFIADSVGYVTEMDAALATHPSGQVPAVAVEEDNG